VCAADVAPLPPLPLRRIYGGVTTGNGFKLLLYCMEGPIYQYAERKIRYGRICTHTTKNRTGGVHLNACQHMAYGYDTLLVVAVLCCQIK
jgi:hypothetical protein